MRLTWTEPADNRNTWILWAVFIVVMMILSAAPKKPRSVTPAYRKAALAWRAGEPIYSGRYSGFLYLPQAAVLFEPFAMLPSRVAEPLWRLVSLGTLAWAIWGLARLVERKIGAIPFFWITLWSLGAMAGMSRNGQMTVLLLACMLLAAVALAEQRWTRAAVWLCLGLALKPLMLVLLLLAAALYGRLAWRVAVGVVVVAALPFLTQHPAYVYGQYQAFAHEMTVASYPTVHDGFVDLFHMLAWMGWSAGTVVRMVGAGVGAAGVLLLCWLARRRMSSWLAALVVLAWAVTYLMLLNPRVEHNTYGMLAPVVSLFAFLEWRAGSSKWLVWGMAAAMVVLAVPQVMLFDPQMWVRQTIALGFVVYLLSHVWRHVTWGEAPAAEPVR